MAGGGRRTGPSPARLALMVLLLAAAVAAEAKVVHVEEPHRRSMLANGLGSAPPMGCDLQDLYLLLLLLLLLWFLV